MCALNGLVVLYEKQFQMAALRSSESEKMTTSNLSTAVTPTGWIHVSIDPPLPSLAETSLEGSSLLGSSNSSSVPQGRNISNQLTRSLVNGLARSESPPASSVGSEISYFSFSDSPPRKTSSTQSFGPSPVASGSSNTAKGVYNHIWKGLVFLASDPCSKVAQLAQFVVHSLHDKVRHG